MKKIIVSLLFILCTTPCHAILSPLNQSIKEIVTILQSSELEQKFPQSQMLQTIQKTATGYQLYSSQSLMRVDIKYAPLSGPGPQKFSLVFHDPVPVIKN